MAENINVIINAKDKLSNSLQKIRNKLKRTGSTAEVNTKKISRGFGMAKVAAGTLATVVTGVLAKSLLNVNSQFEDLQMQFKPLLGGMQEAKSRMKELESFAMVTPYQVEKVAAGSKVLQSFGGEALSTGNSLELVGDAASFAGIGFRNMSMWVGRAYTGLKSGRPIGEAMMRMQELGLVSGETRNKIEALQKQGKNREAWKTLQEELKKVSGTMRDMRKTFTGSWSTLVGRVKVATRDLTGTIFKDLSDGISSISERLNKLNKSGYFQELGKRIKVIIKATGNLMGEVVRTLKEYARSFVNVLRVMNKATLNVIPNIVKWYGKLIKKAAVAMAKHNKVLKGNKDNTQLVYLAQKNLLDVTEKSVGIEKKLKNVRNLSVNELKKMISNVSEYTGVQENIVNGLDLQEIKNKKDKIRLIGLLEDQRISYYSKIENRLNRIKRLFGSDYAANLPSAKELKTSGSALEELRKRVAGVKKEMKETGEESESTAKKTVNNLQKLLDQIKSQGSKDTGDSEEGGGDNKKRIAAVINLQNELAIRQKEGLNKRYEQLRQWYNKKMELVRGNKEGEKALNELFELKQNEMRQKYLEERLAQHRRALQKENEQERKAAEESKRIQRLKIQAFSDITSNLSTIFEAAAKDSKEFAQLQKGIAVTETIINTYKAAQKAYTRYAAFPPLAATAAATAVGAGMAKVATIKSQKFTSSGFVKEGTAEGDTANIRANKGEAYISKADQMNFMRAIRQPNLQTANNNVTVNVTTTAESGYEMAEDINKNLNEMEFFGVN